MIWEIKDKEYTIKKRFAFLPRRIGKYKIWLSFYYRTWDFFLDGIWSGYDSHDFITKEEAIKHINKKKER